ncbi:Nn.00g096140.m01.CDS01 [Neocucurbitaria sp. VM-36]
MAHIQFGTMPRRTTPSQAYQGRDPLTKDFSEIVLQKQIKTMSDLDKEEEARMAKAHLKKTKNMGHGFRAWVAKVMAEKRKSGA